MNCKYFLILIILVSATISGISQTGRIDSTTSEKNVIISDTPAGKLKDTIVPHSPRKATLRSAILPGWGQAYNKQYWKIPLVYAALGIPTGLFVYNNTWYKRTREAYTIRFNSDTSRYGEIDRKLETLGTEDLRYYRNAFRRDRDYAVLYFLLAWGLNVADATVFGHLKNFDVSEDLSVRINPIIHTNGSKGLSLVLVPRETKNHKFILP